MQKTMHQLLAFEEGDIKFLSLKNLNEIIQDKNFIHLPKTFQEKILNLRDLIDRY